MMKCNAHRMPIPDAGCADDKIHEENGEEYVLSV